MLVFGMDDDLGLTAEVAASIAVIVADKQVLPAARDGVRELPQIPRLAHSLS